MPLKLFPPGTRKRNRFYIAKGRIHGTQYEFVCRDENGEKTTDRRAAERCVKRFRATLEAERQGHELRGRAIQTFGEAIDAYQRAQGPGPNDRRYLRKIKAELGDLPVVQVVRDDLLAAGRTLYPDARNETINRQVIAPGSAVLHYAADNDWAPYRRISRLPEREPEIRRPGVGTIELLVLTPRAKNGFWCSSWGIRERASLRHWACGRSTPTFRLVPTNCM
jgi:hypothetical protein